jgi:hypothetical protein
MFRPFDSDADFLVVEDRDVEVVFNRAPQSQHKFPDSDRKRHPLRALALTCALASDGSRDSPPLASRWETALLPFIGSLGFSSSPPGPYLGIAPDFTALAGQLEYWSERVAGPIEADLEIAAARLATAIRHSGSAQGLIDGVIAWESLFGTGQEVSFRVTAALAKLLESDPAERLGTQKRLADIYGLRSKIVHGAKPSSEDVQRASKEAVRVAIQAIKQLLERKSNLLGIGSAERANRLLLVEP